MSDQTSKLVAPAALVVGAALGMAGTFAPSASLRGLAWGLDGTALVVAGALLAVHHLRRGNHLVAAGFFVFVAGQALILATAGMEVRAGAPTFGGGTALWAASLVLVSAAPVMPTWVRLVGLVAAILFAVVAVEIWWGTGVTALSQPLPFFAYPVLVATMVGWAWAHYRGAD